MVLEDKVIDQGAKWRVFSPEQGDQGKKASDDGHASRQRIVNRYRLAEQDFSGKSFQRYGQFYRMRKWQKRSRVSNATEKSSNGTG